MIRVPLGSYQPGDSVMHRLDPRTKIIGVCFLVSFALIAGDWIKLVPVGLVAMLANLAAGTDPRIVFRDIRSLTLFYVMTMILHSVFTTGEPLIVLPFGVMITMEGIYRGLFFCVKIVLLAALFGPMMRTTHPAEWARAVEGFIPGSVKMGRVFRRLSITLGLAMRFLPTLVHEAERIRWAQIGRGLKLGGGLVNRIKSLLPLITPLLAESIRKAEQVTLAMQARGFRIDAPRMRYKPLKLKMIDFTAALVILGSLSPFFY